jgi:cytochrome P450
VAFPLPMAVVGAALGVDEAVWPQFLDWSKHIVDAVDRAGEAEYAAKGAAAIEGMANYFQGLADERRNNLGDDLLSAMIAAAAEEGNQIDEFDMIAIATELGVAGHETTANSVTKSVLAMQEQPGAWDEFVALPEEAMPKAIEELLRFSTPVQRQRWRWVTRDTEFGGRQFKFGDAVVGILGAANRDPEVFENPDVIDFARPNANKHLTFGAGGHFCLGSHLARLELRVATRALAAEMPNLELVERPENIEWNHNFLLPAPHELMVRPS